MWKVCYYDILNDRELTGPEPMKELALRQACAFRKQHGRERVWVVDPSGQKVPVEEIDEAPYAFASGEINML
jgi:hypothetical protein